MTRDDILKAITYTQHHADRAKASREAAVMDLSHAESECSFVNNNLKCLINAAQSIQSGGLTIHDEKIISELVEYYLSDDAA